MSVQRRNDRHGNSNFAEESPLEEVLPIAVGCAVVPVRMVAFPQTVDTVFREATQDGYRKDNESRQGPWSDGKP